MLLSLYYAAKCWRENQTILQPDDFMAYSPSYLPKYVENPDVTFNSIYMNFNPVQLSGLGHSKLKHIEDCPFFQVGILGSI